MKKFLPIICTAFLLADCHHHDDNPTEDEPERTVLVYMAAENNLDSYAADDLKEMMEGSAQLNKRQQLVVYVDRAGTAPPFLARIVDGAYVDSLSLEESLTADPAVLERVLRKTTEAFPAKSYGLVLWGHASGWLINADSIAYARGRAFGGDTGTGSSAGSGRKWMNIPPMARAIRNAMGGTKLKFIFSDCCNMGCVEVAYELRNQTDYVIGSPAEIPDPGAPYQVMVPDMFYQGEDIGQRLIDDYYQYYVDYYKSHPREYYNNTTGDLEGYSVPLCAVKTSELESLASATARLLSTIPDKVSAEGTLNLSDAVCYGYYGYKYAYDMMHVLKLNTSETDFSTWKTFYDKAVPYSLYSAKWLTMYSQLWLSMDKNVDKESDCGSLSMFFPSWAYRSTNPNWNTAIRQYQWNDIIQWQQYGW